MIVVTAPALIASAELASRELRDVAVTVVLFNESVTTPVVRALTAARSAEVVPISDIVIASFPKPVIVPEA